MAKSSKKPAKTAAKKPAKKTVKKPAKIKAEKIPELDNDGFEVIDSKEDLKAFNGIMKPATVENIMDMVALDVERTADEVDSEEIAALLDNYGLNWTVSKKESVTSEGQKTGHFYLQRDDNSVIFPTAIKDGYTIFQNSQLAEMLLRLTTKTGYTMHSGGELAYGQKVYLQLNTNNELKGLGENRTTVKGYLTGLNNHGGGALGLGRVDLTVCCKNTFAMAMQQIDSRFSHYKNIHCQVDKLIQKIEVLEKDQAEQFSEYVTLAGIPITKEAIRQVVQSVWGWDMELSADENKEKGISSQAAQKTADLLESIAKETGYKGKTLWGLFSGVTHYTTHILGKDEKRTESAMIGEGMKINNNAYLDCLDFAGIEY